MNLIGDPGFELGSGWTYTDQADRKLVGDDARSGSYVGELLVWHDFLGLDPVTGEPQYGPWETGHCDYDGTVTGGQTVQCGCWVRRTSGDGGVQLVAYEPATGTSTVLDSLASTDDASSWTLLTGVVTPGSTTLRFRVESLNDADATCDWYVDDCWMVDMAITRTIRAAIISDLEQITTTNGYSQTLAAVLTEPRDVTEVPKPGVFILPGAGGNADVAELGNRTGSATQTFTLGVLVQSATPNADIDNLTDDIRNAVENSSSSTLAVAGVVDVVVTDWSEVVTDPAIADDLYYREAEISVAYEYTRGSA